MIVLKYVLPFVKAIIFDSSGTRNNRYSSYEKDANKAFNDIWNSPEAEHNKKKTDSASGKGGKESKKKTTSTQKLPYKTASLILLIIGGLLIFSGLFVGFNELLQHGSRIIGSNDFAGVIAALTTGAVSSGIGLGLRRKMKTAKKYLSIIGDRGLVRLDDLAGALSVPKSKVKKELQSVIDTGVFGEFAYIDLGCELFLRDSSFKPVTEKRTKSDSKEKDSDTDEYTATLRKIRRLNDEILDEPVSKRIELIEGYTGRIFEYLKKNPDCEKNVHSFMTYYLPTTLKLLESYSEIERVGVAGDNMKSAKENIEKTLDLLVEAFKRLLDKLYESDNIDISTDIDVLEQMMKKDGLSGNGFGVK